MHIKLLDSKEMHGFASGPGMGFFADQLYLSEAGASNILVMDKSWETLDSFSLFADGAAKANPDLKAAVIVPVNKVPFLLMPGAGLFDASGSKSILVNLLSKSAEEFDLSVFYQRLKEAGLEEINITAATVMDDKILLCNQGSKPGTDNCIVVTTANFWLKQQDADIALVKIEFEYKSDSLLTASGLAYSYDNDWLIFTASPAGAPDNIGDTDAGDSYIGMIDNASRKIGRKKLKVKDIVSLSDVSRQFRDFRVSCVCIQADKENKLKLHLAAEKNNGENFLFRVRIKE